jgi:hypothetical protein
MKGRSHLLRGGLIVAGLTALFAFALSYPLPGPPFPAAAPPVGPEQVAAAVSGRVVWTGRPGSAAGAYVTVTDRTDLELFSLVRTRARGWRGTVYCVNESGNWSPGELPPGLDRARVRGLLVEGDPALVAAARKALR